ncbi:MAG: phosphodiester glycosidase family protein [Elainellaceae cyanobacterium]
MLSTVTLCLLTVNQPGMAQALSPTNLFSKPFQSSLLAALGRAFQFAQVPELPAVTQQGNQVILNGRAYPISWSQRQDQIGVADSGLIQAVGVDLLSTTDVGKQPVEWFSDQRLSPIALTVWQSDQYRHLDITELAGRFGWQVTTEGTSLRIGTPAAKVTAVRQGRQSWGDRIVVDLDQATPWQVDEQANETTITIDAPIDPALVRSFRASRGNRITSLKLESAQNRTVIRVGAAGVRSRVWAIPDPNRLLIDVRADSLVERDILWAPGIRWRQQLVALGSDRFPVVSLEIDPRQSGVTLKPITSNPASVIGTAPLVTTAQQNRVVAAINAGFFNRNTQMPLGAIRRDHQWISGPILNRGAIAWNELGEVTVGHLTLQETVVTDAGQRFPVVYLNSGYVGNGVYRHTRDWGTTYTPILDNERVVTVRNQQVTSQQQTRTAGQPAIPIPEDGYLLVIRGNSTAASALAVVGTTIEIETATAPGDFDRFPQIVGAGPLLIQNRQVVLNARGEGFSEAFQQQAAPRSVIATTAEGNFMLVAVHDRVGGRGPTLAEAAQLMQRLGVVNALNLDGGSSTTLYLGGRLLDRIPSTAARVHNGVGVFIQPKS